MSDRPSAAIVGAGLRGLTAAHRLVQTGWDVTVFEATGEIGGRVRTLRVDGYQVDLGASAFSSAYEPYIALCDEVGLERRPVSPFVAIPREGDMHELNMHRMVLSGIRTRLLSSRGKLRARAAWRLTSRVPSAAASWTTLTCARPRRWILRPRAAMRCAACPPSLTSTSAGPIVRTMLIADTDKVSKVELFSGVANIFAAGILTIAGGQGRVCESLADDLDVRLSCPVDRVTSCGSGVEVRHADGSNRYDAAVVTAPLPVAADICPDHADVLAPLRGRLTYTQCLKVAIGTKVQPRTRAFLVQLPSSEDAEIALLFLDHNKCRDRAPAGHGLIDACWESGASARMLDASDDEIVARTLQTILRFYPELDGTVDFTPTSPAGAKRCRSPRSAPTARSVRSTLSSILQQRSSSPLTT